MIRARFKANAEDFRPVYWPPPGPFWCTGYTGDGEQSVVVAYVASEDQIKEFWPEAEEIDATTVSEIVFKDRFPKPDWWHGCKDSNPD